MNEHMSVTTNSFLDPKSLGMPFQASLTRHGLPLVCLCHPESTIIFKLLISPKTLKLRFHDEWV
jgi:hypothetical protein